MTVIAYDGKSIAADRQYTTNSFIEGYVRKIEKWSGGYWASSGRIDDSILFREWLESKKKYHPKLHRSFHGIYSEKGKVWEVYPTLIPMPAIPTLGLGDGGVMAALLMKTGYTAREAVKEVCKHNIYCGGKVDSVRIT